MFVYTERPTFKHPVTVHWPDGDKIAPFEFEGHFVRDPEVDLAEPIDAATPEERKEVEIERLKKVFIGWSGIQTPSPDDPEATVDLAVDPEKLHNLLQHVPIRLGITQAYIASEYGGGLRLGNSAAPRGAFGRKKKRKKTVRH
jgi:hypothetical protein